MLRDLSVFHDQIIIFEHIHWMLPGSNDPIGKPVFSC